MLSILKCRAREKNNNSEVFDQRTFDDTVFKRCYSDYLLGEIKDHLVFYYGEEEYELFLKFFEVLNGKAKFSYSDYVTTYANFYSIVTEKTTRIPKFMSDKVTFLQFLYDLNIVCFIERPESDKPYVRWCFRQRSYSNISPKVKEKVNYEIFYGLHKALNVGQEFIL